jgi:UDPglucose 6-dehydrogenase
MNQIANLCERVGADVDAVRLGIGADERIGRRFLFPGIGYGGSCFPKDVLALIHTAHEHDYDLDLLKIVIDRNKTQQKVLIEKVMRYYQDDVAGKTFALWGLAFKPDTDDVRETPALGMIDAFTKAGATVRVYDPEAMDNVRKLLGDNGKVVFAKDEFDALDGADALLVATEWRQFGAVSLDRVKGLLNESVLFDGRNVFSLDDMRTAGFYYESIGRPIVDPRA